MYILEEEFLLIASNVAIAIAFVAAFDTNER